MVQGHNHCLILGGKAYGTVDRPEIALHCNPGITHDLMAIRKSLPGLEIFRFRSVCGIWQEPAWFRSGVPKIKADFGP